MKRHSSIFELPIVRPSSGGFRRDSLPRYDESDAVNGWCRPGGGGASPAPPTAARQQMSQHLQLQPSLSIEKKRKTVRVSDSHQYYSDYNNDTDEW